MTDAYDWSRFAVTMHYAAPRERVFDYWASAIGLQSFFIGEAQHVDADGNPRAAEERAQTGDSYTWEFLHGFTLEGEFLEVVPDERVVFTFGGDMRVEVSLHDAEGAIEVKLEQTGCATEDPARAWSHVNCRSCWIYFMTNLKGVLEHGTDIRDFEHPERNDSVSIGWS